MIKYLLVLVLILNVSNSFAVGSQGEWTRVPLENINCSYTEYGYPKVDFRVYPTELAGIRLEHFSKIYPDLCFDSRNYLLPHHWGKIKLEKFRSFDLHNRKCVKSEGIKATLIVERARRRHLVGYSFINVKKVVVSSSNCVSDYH